MNRNITLKTTELCCVILILRYTTMLACRIDFYLHTDFSTVYFLPNPKE